MDAEKIQRLRSKAVFRAVEKLIEDEGDGSRLVSQEGVWRASRCMSGEEFEMSLEERSLVGVCGNPSCSNRIDGKLGDKGRRKAYVCCSVFCYEAVEEVAERLGSRKDAAERFMALYESAKYQREKKKKEEEDIQQREKDKERARVEENKRPSSSSGTGRSHAAAGEQLAAGTRKAPVMKAVVQERTTKGRTKKKESSYDFQSIEGYRPKNAKKDGQQQERRVRFSDEEGGAEQSNGMTGNAARFVFDIEDPKGHVEGDVTSLGDQFGTLRVVESNDTQHNHEAPHQPPAAQVDEILAKTMREGAAKYFPHLKSCIPSELYDGHDDDESEDDTYDDDDEWMRSDDDVASDDDDVPIHCHKTFFTEVFSFFDLWITDYTIALMRSENRHMDTSLPQVPEIMTAMQRFLSIACSTLAAKLCAQNHQRTITDSVGQVVRTFRLDQALPAFQSKQWVIVALIIVKAQSLSSHPEYQEFTDSRAAISRIGTVLSDANFTVEEFYAVLELFLLGDDT
ncbi:hypothetical protein M9435_006417 [Picochlorum sp. BPE23]|nr:hypothetical protein M9435_006417 [Picochlorum sp. BPE23]